MALCYFWTNGFPNACSGTRSFAWNCSLSNTHSCFLLLWAAFPILVNASGHVWSGRDVVVILVSLPLLLHSTGLLESFWRSFVQLRKSCKTCPRIWQISVLVDIQIVIHLFFLVQSPDLQKLTWWHQYNLVNRIWFFSRHVQWNFSVQHDDDKWNSFRASAWAQKSLLIPSSSFASSSWNPSFSPDSPWSSPLRFSLSSRWIPVPEWVLGIRSFSLIILLNHLLQEIQIHHLFGLSRLLSHSVFWNILWCTKFPYFIDHLFSNSPMSVIRISFSQNSSANDA